MIERARAGRKNWSHWKLIGSSGALAVSMPSHGCTLSPTCVHSSCGHWQVWSWQYAMHSWELRAHTVVGGDLYCWLSLRELLMKSLGSGGCEGGSVQAAGIRKHNTHRTKTGEISWIFIRNWLLWTTITPSVWLILVSLLFFPFCP